VNIIDAIKSKFRKEESQDERDYEVRKQFNVPINTELIEKVKRLNAEFSVPGYALVEHVLQIGLFYVEKTLENRDVKDIVREHLINQHLLDSNHTDTEEMIRLGEGRFASELIALAKMVTNRYQDLKKEFSQVEKTGDTSAFELTREKLVESALNLARWVSSHPIDELDNEENSKD